MSTDKLVLNTAHPFFGVGLVLIDENLRREDDHLDDPEGYPFDKHTSEEAIGIFGDDEWYITGDLVTFAQSVNRAVWTTARREAMAVAILERDNIHANALLDAGEQVVELRRALLAIISDAFDELLGVKS